VNFFVYLAHSENPNTLPAPFYPIFGIHSKAGWGITGLAYNQYREEFWDMSQAPSGEAP
jgi:hypothetical protein